MRFFSCPAALLIGSLLFLSGPLELRQAQAMVAIAQSVDGLVAQAPLGVVVQVLERISRWENDGSGRRIVTYNRVRFEEPIYGNPPETAWIRNLGGAVDGIGQLVQGQARMRVGERAVVFLQPRQARFRDAPQFVIAAAAQGHFPLETNTPRRLQLSPSHSKIISPAEPFLSARRALVGQKLNEAIPMIQAAHKRVENARKK